MSRKAKRKVTDLQIRRALIANEGKIASTAKDLDVTTATIKRRMKMNPRIGSAWEDIKEGYKDKAMKTIMDHIDNGSLKASTYLMDHLGEDRGFGGKQVIKEDNTENNQGTTINLLDTSDMDANTKKILLDSLLKQQQKQIEGNDDVE